MSARARRPLKLWGWPATAAAPTVADLATALIVDRRAARAFALSAPLVLIAERMLRAAARRVRDTDAAPLNRACRATTEPRVKMRRSARRTRGAAQGRPER